ncbi:MAG: hypothetical protein NC078_07015 [Ruminococcus sp.]|nr:hypothetical protein [Ruminococcus sp.]
MATDSILHNFVIKDDKTLLSFIEALEASEKDPPMKDSGFAKSVKEADNETIQRVLKRIREKNG